MGAVGELTPTQFLARWPDFREGSVILLDVREPHEHEAATVEGSTDIPMAQVPQQTAKLDPDKPIVVLCRSGARSMKVAQFLAAEGFREIFNMTGGIEAWAEELGASVPSPKGGPAKREETKAP